jgi:hypothetical protein
MPFRHPDRSHGLDTRIEIEVRERLEEAVDYVCLEALVRSRRAAGQPPPAADNAAEKRAYTENVLALLRLLRHDLGDTLTPDQQGKLTRTTGVTGDEQTRLVATQVALARLLPDYWQRFETTSTRFLDESVADVRGSGATAPDAELRRESRGLLGRLFGRR